MHDSLIGAPEFPHIFVITRQYEVTDFTGLPTSADYQELGKFETRCIDRIETLQLGIVTFIETFDGIVRYFLYVSDVVAATNALNDANASHMHLELATAHDPHWNEYRAFLRGTQRANDVE